MNEPEIRVMCPSCGQQMVERLNRVNASRFLGCSSYPQCDATQKVPAWLEVKRAGGIELPGMETDQ